MISIDNELFDPLSWWAPLYVQINIICSIARQVKVVRQVKDWDDKIPNDIDKEWVKAIDCFRSLDHMSIPRCKVPKKDKMSMRHEFHKFADSSKTVAAAAVYLRTIFLGHICVHFFAARTSMQSKSEKSRESMPRKKLYH